MNGFLEEVLSEEGEWGKQDRAGEISKQGYRLSYSSCILIQQWIWITLRNSPRFEARDQALVPLPVSHCLWAVPLGQGGEGCGGCNTAGECLFSRRQVSGEGGGYKLLAATAAGGWVRQPRKGDLCQATASSLQSATLLLQCKGGEEGRPGEGTTAPVVTEQPIWLPRSVTMAWSLQQPISQPISRPHTGAAPVIMWP